MARALCTVDDVKRVLHIRQANVDAERDEWLQAEIDGQTSWFVGVARVDWTNNNTSSGSPNVTHYWDVKETDALTLPQPGCKIVSVQVAWFTDTWNSPSDITTLTTDQYDVSDDGSEIRFRPVLRWQIFENAWGSRLPRTYQHVIVTWLATTSSVPASIRDGIAMLAAGRYMSGPRLASGYTQERIGDYQYQVRPPASSGRAGGPIGNPLDYIDEGLRLLRPYMLRRPMVS